MLTLLQVDIGFIGIGHLSENWRNHHSVQVLVLLTTGQHAPICFLVFYCFPTAGKKKKRWENVLNYAGNYSYSTYIVPLLCCIIYNLIPKSFSIEIKSLS